jgi:hypothetical protein
MATSARSNHNSSRGLAVLGDRLLGDAHLTWMAAEAESEHALRNWFDAPEPQTSGAYLAYRAALDREEAAARDLERLSELTPP